jgi:tRNA(Ile)-lysidine synthase
MEMLLHAGKGGLDLPGGLGLEVSEGKGLVAEPAGARKLPRSVFTVPVGGNAVIPEFGLDVKTKVLDSVSSPSRLIRMCTPQRQYFELAAVRPPLEVRFRRPGDSFRPLGTRGTKKLKDFFIDKKVPRFLRDRVPLLLSRGRIMWVMGYAIDEKFKLKPDSTAALRVDHERE